MASEEHQRHLQELLAAARGALEEALEHAKEHDLWFEFTGLRRGPGQDLKTMNVNDEDEISLIKADIEEWGGEMPATQTDVLDISEEWVGSWC
jgi:hypothetical protein